jgi:hypothetical protein
MTKHTAKAAKTGKTAHGAASTYSRPGEGPGGGGKPGSKQQAKNVPGRDPRGDCPNR